MENDACDRCLFVRCGLHRLLQALSPESKQRVVSMAGPAVLAEVGHETLSRLNSHLPLMPR